MINSPYPHAVPSPFLERESCPRVADHRIAGKV